MAAKYFVWGEGVWRELDVASGRVSGWRRRARFVFLRRGQLLVARRRPVLRALETLAAGQAGAAADGRRLAHRSKTESRARQRHKQPAPPAALAFTCEHHHCCAHSRCLDRAPACPAPPASTPGVERREAATQCARVAATATQLASTPSISHEPAPAAARIAAHVVAVTDSSSAAEFVSTRAPTPTRNKLRSNDVSALLGKHAPPSTPPAATEKKRTPSTPLAAAKAKRQTPGTRADQHGDERARPAKTRARTAVLSDKTESTSDEEPLATLAAQGSYRSAPAVCKELVVSEADIAALRGFVARTRPSALARFDADDAYKRALFYAINPLVELERCARLERLLASRSAAALPHFAARLGLAPRSDTSTPPSPARRTRLATHRPRAPSASSDTDKENKDKHSSQNKVRSEPLGGTKPSPASRARALPRPPPPTERSNEQEKDVAAMKAPLTNGVVRDAPTVKRPAPALAPAKKKVVLDSDDSVVAPSVSDVRIPSVPRHVISKRASRANAKEYSNLEDHAIVAWVSSGSRASLVGGNRVWRELQEQYPRLTGRERSWHSLRNRYLRYILPALGALHLPPAEVSRLRAAASTGAIKRANRASGPLAAPRHPMFKEPERGAASRRLRVLRAASSGPGTASDDSDGPVAPKRRSLRARPLDSSSKDGSGKESVSKETSNKDESGKESSSKPSASKEVTSKASGSKETSKASGSKETSKASGSKETSKASGSKETSKASGSKETSKASGSKETSKASGSKETSKASGSKETSNKDESGKESTSKPSSSKEVNSKAGSSKARSPRYSEVTRRFAARHRPAAAAASSSASPVTSREPSPVLTPTRTRRLFNPNANV